MKQYILQIKLSWDKIEIIVQAKLKFLKITDLNAHQ
jgi:hypothetical protein